jgi:hypothetical protein
MATTKWIKTMSDNVLNPVNYGSVMVNTVMGFSAPNPFVFSGNGKVFYSTLLAWGEYYSMVRYEYIDNAWTHETFMFSQSSIAGAKYVPNFAYFIPVATNEDGTTLVMTESFPQTNRKIIVISYIDGQLVQVGPEITFTAQSNFNLANPSYFIQRAFISNNGLKIVLVTHGGINTLVFSNGSWNLLPASEDILPIYFQGGYNEIGSASNMSKNGMYLTLLGGTNFNAIVVLKFDNQINNWVLFKTINDITYIYQTLVSNNGNVVLSYDGWGNCRRYEYNLTTNNYELIQTIFALGWGGGLYASDDCNSFIYRRRHNDWEAPHAVLTYIRMYKWTNGNWIMVEFPSNVVPARSTSLDQGNHGFLIGASNDLTSFATTDLFIPGSEKINVYYNVPLPTLSVGGFASIKEQDANFNEANVLVKAPTLALNVSNKQYVDTADAEIHALIIASATTDTTSTTEYYDLLEERQTVQSTLATQIENLYQYFFDQSRDGPVPSRT